MDIREIIDNINKKKQKLNEELYKQALELEPFINYENDNPKIAINNVINLNEFKNIIKTYSNYKEIASEHKKLLFLGVLCIFVLFFISALVSGSLSVLEFLGINSITKILGNLMIAFMIIVGFVIYVIMFVFIIRCVQIAIQRSKGTFKEKSLKKNKDFGFCKLREVFMKGIIPNEYNIIAVSNEYAYLAKQEDKIEEDCRLLRGFSTLTINSLIKYNGGKDRGYYGEIELKKRKRSKNRTYYVTVFKGFIVCKKFNQKRDYFQEEEGFIIKQGNNERSEILFNTDELNSKLMIQTKNKSDDLTLKIQQFLSPETEEIIYGLYKEYKDIRLMISNEGIIMMIETNNYNIFGDHRIDKVDCKYETLYHEYEKVYCLEALYKRLLRNMTGEVDEHFEKEMRKWLNQKLTGEINQNKDWDKWIDEIWEVNNDNNYFNFNNLFNHKNNKNI